MDFLTKLAAKRVTEQSLIKAKEVIKEKKEHFSSLEEKIKEVYEKLIEESSNLLSEEVRIYDEGAKYLALTSLFNKYRSDYCLYSAALTELGLNCLALKHRVKESVELTLDSLDYLSHLDDFVKEYALPQHATEKITLLIRKNEEYFKNLIDYWKKEFETSL